MKYTNYIDMLKDKPQDKTAIITEEKEYTYGEIIQMAKKVIIELPKNAVCVIRENTILKQLIKFIACMMHGVVPMIAPYDTKILPKECESDDFRAPDGACMAVMTSGTTGVPKILFRTFESWAEYFEVQNKTFGIDSDSVLLAQGSLAFTGNMNLYLAQFYAGAAIVAEDSFNPELWVKHMIDYNVNSIYLIPSKLLLLPGVIGSMYRKGSIKEKKFSQIKTILSGSQSLGKEDTIKLKSVFTDTKIVLYYGASELNYISYVTDEDMTSDRNLIGKPFPEVDIRVIDDNIYINTKYHVMGIECPYTLNDKGYIDDEGRLYFLGRSDDIMNIKGRKVSSVRIQNEIESLPGISESSVMLIEDGGKQILTAFVVRDKYNVDKTPESDDKCLYKNISDDEKEMLRKTLSHYEMPRKFIVMDSLPKNESGKINTDELKKMYEISRRV